MWSPRKNIPRVLEEAVRSPLRLVSAPFIFSMLLPPVCVHFHVEQHFFLSVQQQGKLRAELVGTTRKVLVGSGDAPGRSDLHFVKSPLDLKILLENGGGDDGNNNSVLFLQHLADRQGNTLLHWAMERMDTR